MQTAYIGLGSNQGNPTATLVAALDALQALTDTPIRVSGLYCSAPVGPVAQPDFFNAVAELKTAPGPWALLSALQSIEHRHGRIRTEHWGPRTLDLDLLLWGNLTLHTRRLQVPHPQMTVRAFVLRPLADLTGEEFLLHGRTLGDWLEPLSDQAIHASQWPERRS